MSEQNGNLDVIQFYEDCFIIAASQVIQLENRKSVLSTLQAFRYVLKKYLKEKGSDFVINRIINAHGGMEKFTKFSDYGYADRI